MFARTVQGLAVLASAALAAGQEPTPESAKTRPLAPIDVFDLEYAADPQIAPDGASVVYRRTSFDVMTDRARSDLWVVATDGSGRHRPWTRGGANASSPRWSPDGTRLAYLLGGAEGAGPRVVVRWLDTGTIADVATLRRSAADLCWSPDGRWLAFTMLVEQRAKPWAAMPPKPDGAEWAAPPKVIRRAQWRADGRGELPSGHRQLFVVPSDGGTPRPLTSGPFDVDGPLAWRDASTIVFSSNRREDRDDAPRDSELWSVDVGGSADAPLTRWTTRYGPDQSPAISADGSKLAWLGFDDEHQGYQVTRLYVRTLNGDAPEAEPRVLGAELDRSVSRPIWAPDGDGVFVQFDDEGRTKVAFVALADGAVTVVCDDVGGTTLGRPYASGSYSVAGDGRIAYTRGTTERPADVGLARNGADPRVLTRLNEDLLPHRELARVEELRYPSSHDGREIQAWLAYPPGFDASERYPLLLEIHGGPFANYGFRFSAEVQLYAAAGYVVLYVNPRGSTSYGEAFGNAIHHAYPGDDYDDLLSGVDATIARGFVDESRLFVTGGSGGGVLTSWIVGKTDRFRAAVVAKPVINWYSFVLTADAIPFFWRYWFPGPPWEHFEHYHARSPISLVGSITTPTMLLTGEQDFRTPIGESEQLFHALKIRGVETALVRIPGASHGIAARPSRLIAKVAHVLQWFADHGGGK